MIEYNAGTFYSAELNWIQGLGDWASPLYFLNPREPGSETHWSVLCADSSGYSIYKNTYNYPCDTAFGPPPFGIQELDPNSNSLFKIVDLMGREMKPKNNVYMIYIYDDGTREKRIYMY